ncbi:MAG: cytochrome c oxidase subunit 3 [Pseudomonadota bacterium]|nr:cytochrome c oxidase subunit 3 [Pseudomonadota bacterium]
MSVRQKQIPKSAWPLFSSLALLLFAFGLVSTIQGDDYGKYFLILGSALLIYVAYGWFKQAIRDGQNMNPKQFELSDRVYRWSMGWFIFSEFCLFATFFVVLFYVRMVTLPWLSGSFEASASRMTHTLLWPSFEGGWPLLSAPDPKQFTAPQLAMVAWGIPMINTFILLLSGMTITIAHGCLIKRKITQAVVYQSVTALLGILFLVLQAWEYLEAYQHLGLKFESAIYGNIFYLLTGFHGCHVLLGTVMLLVIAIRIARGHFSGHNHFAFEAVSWYWHFVDVIWLFLFMFVYLY